MSIDRRRLIELAAAAGASAAAPLAGAVSSASYRSALRAQATSLLATIHEARNQGAVGLLPFFILDVGDIFVQALARSGRRAIQVEAVSAKSLPAIGALLTPAKIHLLAELGFKPPGYWSPNYWQNVEIAGPCDLDRAGRLMAAAVTEVYGVQDPTAANTVSLGDLTFKEPRDPWKGASAPRGIERQAAIVTRDVHE